MRDSCLDFIARLDAEAHGFGWTDAQLFAVHPVHVTLQLDYCGALMISGNPVRGVEADRIVFERGAYRRDKPGQVWGVPVWEFVATGG